MSSALITVAAPATPTWEALDSLSDGDSQAHSTLATASGFHPKARLSIPCEERVLFLFPVCTPYELGPIYHPSAALSNQDPTSRPDI